MEQWKAIAGYEGLYQVSNLGRVKSLNYNHTGTERIIISRKNRGGYLYVKRKTITVHRLVATAFISNPHNLETINHKDEDKTNNTVSNLEWMSIKDNINYGTHNKRASETQINDKNKSKAVQMFDRQGNLLATFPSTHEAERVTGIDHSHISKCCNGKHKSTGGYIWRYI